MSTVTDIAFVEFMTSFLRTLDAWTTHQDYLWFLAALAWGSVAAGAWRREPDAAKRWLVTWALANVASALAELHLLASNVDGPYVAWDRSMLIAQGVATASLAWNGLRPRWASRAVPWAAVLGGSLLVLGLIRDRWPVAGGLALVLAQACAVRELLRPASVTGMPAAGAPTTRRAASFGLQVAIFWPLLAPHGPLAHAFGMGRINQDFSRFALAASTCLTVAGAAWCVAIWRQRLLDARAAEGSELRIKFRRSLAWLAAWLFIGLGLIVWSGREARRSFEASLTARVATAAQVIDARLAAEGLGPALQTGAVRERFIRNAWNPDRAIEQMHLPVTSGETFKQLRAQLGQIKASNPDITFIFLTTIRAGRLVLTATAADRTPENPWRWVLGKASAADMTALAEGRPYLEGPYRIPFGQFVAAKAPLRDPTTGQVLGWLEFRHASTHWVASSTQARLQTMALVGLGVGLWALAVAYELRSASADAARRRAAAAAEADRVKSTILASVSHELRTPIQSVLGYGELLAGESLPGPAAQWVDALRTHGRIMLQLVNDLIDYSVLKSGVFRLQPRTTDLRRLVEDCVLAVRPQGAAKGLAVRYHFTEPVPTMVYCDPVRVRQVLLNLLANGVKFSRVGEVGLHVRPAAQPADESGRVIVEFIVSDSGPGIAPEDRGSLFTPFSRLGAADGTEGAGLGLALVARLCETMGGGVRLEDGRTEGATFVVTLPLEEASFAGPARATAGASRSQAWADVRVLVAEDNTIVRELLVAFLQRHGARVSAVPDGMAAVTAARHADFDVVLLDWMLPGQDGLATARALRALRPAHEPFIIGLSAHARTDAFAQVLNAGMNAFVPKPVDLAALAEVISQAPGVPALQLSAQLTDVLLLAKLQARFSADLRGLVEEISAAAHAGDWETARERAHYLKNSADYVGARVLGRACGALGEAADAPQGADLAALGRAIRQAADNPFGVSTAESDFPAALAENSK